MKEFLITPQQDGKRLDKWLLKEMPLLPMSLMQKYFRHGDIKINGKAAKGDARIAKGDTVRVYIPDEFFEKPKRIDKFLTSFRHSVTPAYEDENLLIVDKPVGLMVHSDETEKVNTLINHVKAYLYQKGEYDSFDPESFAPVPCNRIDRFTGGLVIFAKNRDTMEVINAKIRTREIEKYYVCTVVGVPEKEEGVLENYLLKVGSRVRIKDRPVPDAQYARTAYRVLASQDGLSKLECRIYTGRTHQIRAQLAHCGYPILGDTQYGDARANEEYDCYYQLLRAYKLVFSFESDAGILNYMNSKTVQVEE